MLPSGAVVDAVQLTKQLFKTGCSGTTVCEEPSGAQRQLGVVADLKAGFEGVRNEAATLMLVLTGSKTVSRRLCDCTTQMCSPGEAPSRTHHGRGRAHLTTSPIYGRNEASLEAVCSLCWDVLAARDFAEFCDPRASSTTTRHDCCSCEYVLHELAGARC